MNPAAVSGMSKPSFVSQLGVAKHYTKKQTFLQGHLQVPYATRTFPKKLFYYSELPD